jgi:hypothetical protein
MIDELVEVSGKSGPHVVWRPGTNGELVVAAPSGGLPFEVAFQDVKRWNPAGDKFPRARVAISDRAEASGSSTSRP